MKRVYKLVFTEQTVTDEGVVVKEKPTVMGQVCEPESHFANMLVPEVVISQTALLKLYECLKVELEHPNHAWKNKGTQPDIKEPPVDVEPTIIPLFPNRNNENEEDKNEYN